MEKWEVRRLCRDYRKRLGDSEYASLSRQIAANLTGLPEFETARVVHAYWPLLAEREVDIRPVLCYLRALGHTVGLPVVDFSSLEPRLGHRVWESECNMVLNRWGILEPVEGPEFPLDEIDVVLVPAFGLDREGNRVGFGKGYYDGFLAQIDVPFVCPTYDACMVECINTAPHDVSMHVSVTENGVTRYAP